MSKKRTPIPKDIAAKVLFDSDRTCCVCRKEHLRIQIHHIDEDPTNHDHENLAVLCFDCHWETQITGGFDRKLDANQIRLYKEDWLSLVKTKRNKNQQEKPAVPSGDQTRRDHIEYEVVQESISSYSSSEVLKNSGYLIMSVIATIVASFSALGAGLYFHEPVITWFAAPIAFIGFFFLQNYVLFIKLLFLPTSDKVDRYIDGKYIHKGSDGNYTVYEKVAQCNFPRCEGIVKIYNAPPRERHKHGAIGRCNLDPHLHTLTVDFNGAGFYKEMDFRPLPQQTN